MSATLAGNSLLFGAGAPANSIGRNGNFYLDTTNNVLYGPKAGGAWPGSGIPLANTYKGDWTALTAYKANDLVTFAGALYSAKVNFTSGASFNAANWNALSVSTASLLSVARRSTAPWLRGQFASYLNAINDGKFAAFSGSDFTAIKRKTTGPSAMSDLRLYFGNFYTTLSASAEAAVANTVTVKAAIVYNGVVYPVWFPGANGATRSVTIESGGFIESLPVPVEIPANTNFTVRTRVVYTGDCPSNGDQFVQANGDGYSAGDAVDSAAAAGTLFGTGSLVGPLAITGEAANPAVRQVAMIGDSICVGVGDTTPNSGYVRRALGTSFVNVAIAQSGTRADQFPWKLAKLLIASADYAIEQYGINDFVASRTNAQVQADRLRIWTLARNRGCQVFAATITPNTGSTDSWATVINQSLAMSGPNEASRVAHNQWLRDGAPIDATTLAAVAVGTSVNVLRAGQTGHPAAGVFNIAGLAESAQDSGFWKAGYTSDGIHPNTTGHTALAAGVNTALFI